MELSLELFAAGPVLLEQAGLLKGRRIAHGYKEPQLQFLREKGFFKDTELTNEPFIIQDQVITARPDSFIDFAVEISVLAKVIDPSKKVFWKEYYRGKQG